MENSEHSAHLDFVKRLKTDSTVISFELWNLQPIENRLQTVFQFILHFTKRKKMKGHERICEALHILILEAIASLKKLPQHEGHLVRKSFWSRISIDNHYCADKTEFTLYFVLVFQNPLRIQEAF